MSLLVLSIIDSFFAATVVHRKYDVILLIGWQGMGHALRKCLIPCTLQYTVGCKRQE